MDIEVRWLLAALAVSAFGCGTSEFQPLNRTLLRSTHPRTLTIAASRSPTMDLEIGALGFGLVGAFQGLSATFRAEAEIAGQDPIPDPVVDMRQQVGAALAKRFALQVEDRGKFVTKASSADDLMKDYPRSDLILDIRTTQWSMARAQLGNSTNAEHIAIRYRGVLRLIDARQKVVIAEASCTSIPVDTPDMPTVDELLANEGALFRSALKEMAQYCADDYRKRVLGLY